jgi:hypothetical protein
VTTNAEFLSRLFAPKAGQAEAIERLHGETVRGLPPIETAPFGTDATVEWLVGPGSLEVDPDPFPGGTTG